MKLKPTFRRNRDERVDYAFVGGYPTRETVQRAYDDADLNRAIQAYRFFYPTVSGLAIYQGNEAIGLVPNRVFGVLDTQPRHVSLTHDSDTVYGPMLLDLHLGPMIVELPPGPLMAVAIDIYQGWVADMGLTGPDAGNGGEHLILPPRYGGNVPLDYHVWGSASNRVILTVRSFAAGGDVRGAMDRLRNIRVVPLSTRLQWEESRWVNLTDRPQDTTPGRWEGNLEFWHALHTVIDSEPPVEQYFNYYGELATLGITKGSRFEPDARMRGILEEAALIGNGQMRVQAFADRRPERVVWPDRQWEWIGLRTENADFSTGFYTDLGARETWFYQAMGASPTLFRRAKGVAPLHWLCAHDADGNYLDGAKTYLLIVPQPVPSTLFWSITVYDAMTRSEIQTEQRVAALRSQVELKDEHQSELELFFGPTRPRGAERRWIKTTPGHGWFAYFRIYGAAQPAFDRTWRVGDFTPLRHDDAPFFLI